MLAKSALLECSLGDLVWTANNLGRLAETLALEGHAEVAARLLSSAHALHETIGVGWASWAAEMNEETTAIVRKQLGDAAFAEAAAEGRNLTAGEAVELALGAVR